MPIIFNPTGPLDVATDPSDLPEQVQERTALSGAMRRCTNLHLERKGVASTRKGTGQLNSTVISAPNRLLEQGGVRYAFGGANIYRNETSIASSLTSADWSAVLYNPYNVTTQAIYAINGTDRKKIEDATVYEWGITPPAAAPTCLKTAGYACFSSADYYGLTDYWLVTTQASDHTYVCFDWESAQIDNGDSTFPESNSYVDTYHFENESAYSTAGKYEVVYTYARYSGSTLVAESDPSDAAETQIVGALNVTWVASTDTQVTHVRIYRSLADTAGVWYYMGAFAVGDLTATISMTDESLGAAVSTNHDRPPLGTQIIGPSFGGQLFMLKDNLLYYSLPLQPEYWPPTYYVEVTPPQFPLMAAAFFGGNLLVASEHEIFLVSGTSASSYFAQPMSAVTGTVSRNCFVAVKGHGVFHLGNDGLYLYTTGKDECISDMRFQPIFNGETMGSLPGIDKTNIANCLLLVKDNKLWFGYPATGETYCRDFLIFDLESNNAVHYQYPFAVKSICIDYENDRILAGDEDGYIRVLDHSTVPDDNGTAISWQLESKQYSQFPKYFPRYARWDVELNDGATANGYIILNDEIKQTHALTTSRATRKRLVTTCTGTRMSVRVTGSGPVDIFGVEVE